MDSAEYMTADQVAEMLQVERDWVIRQYQKKKLRGVRLAHRTVRFKRTDVDEFISERMTY